MDPTRVGDMMENENTTFDRLQCSSDENVFEAVRYVSAFVDDRGVCDDY